MTLDVDILNLEGFLNCIIDSNVTKMYVGEFNWGRLSATNGTTPPSFHLTSQNIELQHMDTLCPYVAIQD